MAATAAYNSARKLHERTAVEVRLSPAQSDVKLNPFKSSNVEGRSVKGLLVVGFSDGGLFCERFGESVNEGRDAEGEEPTLIGDTAFEKTEPKARTDGERAEERVDDPGEMEKGLIWTGGGTGIWALCSSPSANQTPAPARPVRS